MFCVSVSSAALLVGGRRGEVSSSTPCRFFHSFSSQVLIQSNLWHVHSKEHKVLVVSRKWPVALCSCVFNWPVSRLLKRFVCDFLLVCVCVRHSSGMKRLPFSDDEFVAPPTKIARGEEEPKKGTSFLCVCVCVWVCFDSSHARGFRAMWLSEGAKPVRAPACACVCVARLPPEDDRTLSLSSLWAMWSFEVFQNTHTCPRHWPTQRNTTDQCVHTCKQARALYPISYS